MGNANLFVAETDELGRIVCVWRKNGRERAAHPVRNPSRHIAVLQEPTTQVSGASLADIAAWMSASPDPV